jgi:hypothetical protein
MERNPLFRATMENEKAYWEDGIRDRLLSEGKQGKFVVISDGKASRLVVLTIEIVLYLPN